jgi:hypothetical protein
MPSSTLNIVVGGFWCDSLLSDGCSHLHQYKFVIMFKWIKIKKILFIIYLSIFYLPRRLFPALNISGPFPATLDVLVELAKNILCFFLLLLWRYILQFISIVLWVMWPLPLDWRIWVSHQDLFEIGNQSSVEGVFLFYSCQVLALFSLSSLIRCLIQES